MSFKPLRLCVSLSAILLATALVPASAAETGGFSLGSTRVIYNADQKEATFTVLNSAESTPFLAQSWISSYDKQGARPPFVITPPLYRQDKGKNTLRIMRVGGALPEDRESAFWINVKAVPATSKPGAGENRLSFAYVLRIKMFYRPAGLTGDAAKAYQQLVFTKQNNNLVVKNPTPYHITFNKVSVGGKDIKDVTAMVPPKGQQTYSLPAGSSGINVTFKTINDMGGVLPEQNTSLR